MNVIEVLGAHGIGVGKYRKNKKIKNMNLSSPEFTARYISMNPILSPFLLSSDKNSLYAYFSNKEVRKYNASDGSLLWSNIVDTNDYLYDIVLDPSDNLWVCTDSRVVKYSSTGSQLASITTHGGGHYIHVDSNHVYLVKSENVKKFTHAGGLVWTTVINPAPQNSNFGVVFGDDGIYLFFYDRAAIKIGYDGAILKESSSPIYALNKECNGQSAVTNICWNSK